MAESGQFQVETVTRFSSINKDHFNVKLDVCMSMKERERERENERKRKAQKWVTGE